MIVRNMQFLLKLLKWAIVLNISAKVTRDSRCAYYIPYSAGNFKNFVCFQLMSIFVYVIWVVNRNTSTFIDIWFVSQFFFILTYEYSFHAYILCRSLLLLAFDEIHHVFVWRKNYIDRNVHWWLLTSCGVQNSWKISGLRLTWQIEMYCH